MNTTLRMSLGVCALLICLVLPNVSDAVEGECIVTVGNRTAILNDEGAYEVPNIPNAVITLSGQSVKPLYRARAYCFDENNNLVRGQTAYFVLESGQTVFVPTLDWNEFSPVPTALRITTGSQQLQEGEQTQLQVLGLFADASSADVTARSQGTVYLSSNPAAVTLSNEGVATARARQEPTTVTLFAVNEGQIASINVLVGASPSNDIDGDGIPNAYELLFA